MRGKQHHVSRTAKAGNCRVPRTVAGAVDIVAAAIDRHACNVATERGMSCV
jgi:hypothetical protein